MKESQLKINDVKHSQNSNFNLWRYFVIQTENKIRNADRFCDNEELIQINRTETVYRAKDKRIVNYMTICYGRKNNATLLSIIKTPKDEFILFGEPNDVIQCE